jgi:hypothetical protein
MRTLLTGGVLAILVFALSACGGSSGSSASEQETQEKADTYEISQIERSFHQAISKKDIDELVGLFAPMRQAHSARKDRDGKGANPDRLVGVESVEAETHWLSDHPAWKAQGHGDGDRGTLHFECHFIDVDTKRSRSTPPAISTSRRSTASG